MDKSIYIKRRYALVGRHSAVKICAWTRNSLAGKGVCYKQKFYGIRSHRCLQMTPAIAWCEHSCLFCWRPTEFTQGRTMEGVELDNPSFIVEKSIEAQRKLLIGFKGNPKVPKGMFEEAMNPNQAAISLAGEPTLYPKINELIAEFHRRGFTTFLVSNGMNPDVIKNLNPLPTQLYITLVASNPDDYVRITRSSYGKQGFDRLMRTVRLLKGIKTRRVLRLTLVKGYNMKNPEEYAEIIKSTDADFVEAKAYMYVGDSRNRLTMDNMPSFDEIRAFAKSLADALGWKVIDEHEPSRVCLIAKEDYKWRHLDA